MIWDGLRWLANNLSSFLLALILAFIVWILAVINADPNITCPEPTSIPLEIIGRDTSFLLFGEIPEAIEIQLRAPRSVCDRLANEQGAVLASIDLSTLRPGDHTVEVNVQISEQYRPVRELSVSPITVSFTLEEFETRFLPVLFDISGDPAPGFTIGPTIVSDSRVKISGRKSFVDKVSEAIITLDITNAVEDIDADRAVTLLDDEGNPVTGLSIEPETINVKQYIQRPSTYREVTVRVITTGQPPDGYRLTNITAFPQVVTVYSSSPQLVREMPSFVETEPITLTGAINDIEQRVFLILPEGVSVAGEQSVLVQITIAAIESSDTFSVEVEKIGLSAGLEAEFVPETVDVILSGPLPTLQSLTLDNIRVVLDLTDLAPGQYHIQPRVEILPVGLLVESILPATIEVTIIIAPTPTFTPTIDPAATITPTTTPGIGTTPTVTLTPTP